MTDVSAYRDIVSAYQGVEHLDNFDDDQLAVYRQELLDRTAEQASFVFRHIPSDAAIVEVGTGNGRLLIVLEQQGLLREALGIDVSESRIEFARRWADDLGLSRIRFEAADVLATSLPDCIDVIVCITGTFAYFDAVQRGAGERLLKRAHEALKPGGTLILELYPHSAWRRLLERADDHELRPWQELPDADPWRFYLSHLSFFPDTQVLSHHKTFIHRTSGEIDDARTEHLRLYDEATIHKELQASGYQHIASYGDWTGRTHRPDDERLIVVARRP